jgi:hypothetical protein
MSSPGRVQRDRRVELIAAVLLSIATVVTAWSAYQATRWSGEQADNYSVASARRTESVRASTLVNRQVLIDVTVYLDWLNAWQTGDEELEALLRSRMRPEFLPAFEAWLGDLGPGVIPAGTPFTQPEYVLAAEEESAELEAEATLAIDAAREANQVSDDFVLAAVLFASVLFFSGLAGTFDSFRAQVILLALAGVMLVMGTVIVLTLPQNVAF